jgi:hypothetical protein
MNRTVEAFPVGQTFCPALENRRLTFMGIRENNDSRQWNNTARCGLRIAGTGANATGEDGLESFNETLIPNQRATNAERVGNAEQMVNFEQTVNAACGNAAQRLAAGAFPSARAFADNGAFRADPPFRANGLAIAQAAIGTASILPAQPLDLTSPLPADAVMILSAMEAGGTNAEERRAEPRMRYRRRAALRLFADAATAEPWILYTRDSTQRGLGFIARRRVPLGYGGVVELLAPDGERVSIACTLFRCCQTHGDWYAGALYFNRAQPLFALGADDCDVVESGDAIGRDSRNG